MSQRTWQESLHLFLPSRGADIIESLRQKQIAHRHDHEKQVLHKIKRKMERIRATQQKMLRPLDKQTHFDGKSVGKYRLCSTTEGGKFSRCVEFLYKAANL